MTAAASARASTTAPTSLPRTLGELRLSGWVDRGVRDELRRNLVERLRDGRPALDGLVGYDDTVLPDIERAILAGQDILLVGERGQGKSRIVRLLTGLLDEWMPYVAGCELRSSPYRPLTAYARGIITARGDGTPIEWLHRDRRLTEKLATPDTSVADLLGDVDPIKVAEGRHLADEGTIHYGLLPRSNRGLFAMNELPDLPSRIQVALLNVLEERDVQVRGYPLRIDLDLLVVATANPDDYTNRGRIISPLKDRLGAQVRTHYPMTLEDELAIVEQEAQIGADDVTVHVPAFLQQVVARLTHELRGLDEIDHRSGVSVRFTVGAYETMVAGSVRRAVRTNASTAVPRVVDLWPIVDAALGRVELDAFEPGEEREIVADALRRSILAVWSDCLDGTDVDRIMTRFRDLGLVIETSELTPSGKLLGQFGENVDGLSDWVRALGVVENDLGVLASVVEFVLEGLHLAQRLTKVVSGGRVLYSA